MISTLAGIFVFLASVFIVSRKESVPEPIEKLANFAIVQATRFNQTDHKDVQLSEYTTFVKSACVSCATRELAQKALRLQISSLPEYIVNEIVDMALPEGASIETARQNTADETGRVSVFMYYINTVYNESERNRYKTCVRRVAGHRKGRCRPSHRDSGGNHWSQAVPLWLSVLRKVPDCVTDRDTAAGLRHADRHHRVAPESAQDASEHGSRAGQWNAPQEPVRIGRAHLKGMGCPLAYGILGYHFKKHKNRKLVLSRNTRQI